MLPHRKARAVLHTVKDQCWYAGPVSEKKAEEVLSTYKDTPGAFLLRDSLLPDADFFLSLLDHNSDIRHYPIHLGIDCSCSLNGYTFDDLPTCVYFYTENRIAGVFLQLPTFPLLKHSEIPMARKQPVIRFAAPDQRSYKPAASSRPVLVPIAECNKETADSGAIVSTTRDPTYESMEEGEIESFYESQLTKVSDHIYDSLISFKDEGKPAVEVVVEKNCDKAEDNCPFTSQVGDQHQSLNHVIEKGVVYTLPNKKVKKMADCLTTTPETRFVPKFCSTLKLVEDAEQGEGVVRQLTKKLESLSVQYMVPPPPPPPPPPPSLPPCTSQKEATTSNTTHHPHDATGDHKRRRPPPPPPPPRKYFTPLSLPADNLKKSSNVRQPFRRGSMGDLVPSYIPTKAVPTAIVATLPRRPSSWIAGDTSMMTQYRNKRPQKYCSYPSIPDTVEEVGSSLPSSSASSSSSSSGSLRKKDKKSMLKRLLRLK